MVSDEAAIVERSGADLEARAWAVLREVWDPEIPVLSIIDLGIVRTVRCSGDRAVTVGISPTYSGCPATHAIKAEVVRRLRGAGFEEIEVLEVLAPPWSSDWITPAGRERLLAYGIAPPVSPPRSVLGQEQPIACPRCGSQETECLSEFGSTPCKALHRCRACLEPFEHFKCI